MLFFAAVAAILAHVQGLQSHLVSTQALQNAELLTEAVAEFRTVYTSEVVERIRPSGVEITHDYLLHEGAVPLPATLSMILGNRIGAPGSGVESRLYSAYPFPWADDDGGLPDDFAREAWEALTHNPEEPFYRFEVMEGRDVLRYATAVRLHLGSMWSETLMLTAPAGHLTLSRPVGRAFVLLIPEPMTRCRNRRPIVTARCPDSVPPSSE